MIAYLTFGILFIAMVAMVVFVYAIKQAVDGYEDETGFHRAATLKPLKPKAWSRADAWPEIKTVAPEFGEGI